MTEGHKLLSNVKPYFSPSTALSYRTVSLKFARRSQQVTESILQ